MLCQVGTLRKSQLRHDGIRARVFFLAFFLQEFDLLPTLQNFRKRALGVPLANLTQLGSTGTFRGAVCSKMLCQVGTLRKFQLRHNGIRARVFFLAFFLQEFDLLPTLQNFRKRALGVPLANLTQLGSTGTFRGAVCSKMLCQVGTLRKLQLGHDGIRARVFFLAFFLQEFDLLPTLQNFRKRALGGVWPFFHAVLGPLGKFNIARLHGHFQRRGLQQNAVLSWHFKEILVKT